MASYKVEINLNLIQNIRLVQSLMEEHIVYIDEKYKYIFDHLNKTFNNDNYMNLNKINLKDVNICLLNLQYDHSKPSVKMLGQEWTLLFPKSMINYLHKKWMRNRVEISFSGILNRKRLDFIYRFLKQKEVSMRTRLFIIKANLMLIIPARITQRIIYSLKLSTYEYEINFTNNGRHFPRKAWDEEYFNRLLNSKFVLCPDGDFVWTYRFFEAIICGAIPIVENKCNAYEGFRYLTINDFLEGKSLSSSDIDFNYKKILSEFTYRL